MQSGARDTSPPWVHRHPTGTARGHIAGKDEMDEAKLEQFMGQAVTDLGAAISGLMVYLGDQLGLYKAMAGAGPVTPADIAARCTTKSSTSTPIASTPARYGYRRSQSGHRWPRSRPE